MKEIAKKLNEKYGAGTVNLTLKEEYRNMAEKIRENFHLIENAKKAVKKSGVEPQVVPVRGGTDGARLSFFRILDQVEVLSDLLSHVAVLLFEGQVHGTCSVFLIELFRDLLHDLLSSGRASDEG